MTLKYIVLKNVAYYPFCPYIIAIHGTKKKHAIADKM